MFVTLLNTLLEEIQLGRYEHLIVDCVSYSKMLHGVLRLKHCCSLHLKIADLMMELGKQGLVELLIELLPNTLQGLLRAYFRINP